MSRAPKHGTCLQCGRPKSRTFAAAPVCRQHCGHLLLIRLLAVNPHALDGVRTTGSGVAPTPGANQTTVIDSLAQARAEGEHLIHVTFASTGSAAVPVFWSHTADDAAEMRSRLAEHGSTPADRARLMWTLPVSDVPRLP